MTDLDNKWDAAATLYVVAGADLSNLAAAPEYRGQVEILKNGVVAGWCFSTVNLQKPVKLELWIGDTKIMSFLTSGARPDLEKAVGLPMRPAFRASVARSQALTVANILAAVEGAEGVEAPNFISVRVADQPVELQFKPGLDVDISDLVGLLTKPALIPGHLEALEDDQTLRGRVEVVLQGAIYGWCVDVTRPTDRLQLEVYYKDVLMGVISTVELREDVNRLLGVPATTGFGFRPSDIGAADLPALMSVLSSAPSADDTASQESPIAVKVLGFDCFLSVPADVRLDAEALRLYHEAAAAKLLEISRNKKIERAHAMMTAPPRKTNLAAPYSPSQDIGVVAFYLPQFHPFPENDEWWGTGFTEWSNVTAAKPNFPGQNQPRVPADLGYYDLRLELVQKKQVELAKQYKVSGFCYYYYSFAGKTLMTLPIDRHLEQNYDLDFCLCWANENWSRRWDGSEDDILMRQSHSELDDNAFIDQVMKYFESPRYIKVGGAPLLLIYRVTILRNPASTIKAWKAKTKAAGYTDLHVCVCETFGLSGPTESGADSSCQFPPHGVNAKEIQARVADLDKEFMGKIYDYVEVAANEVRRPDPDFLRFRTAMPAWDNTSRKGRAAHVFHNASPAIFEAWLAVLCAKARRNQPPGRRMVFVNAWNEWAEGAHLEPDRRDGLRNLKAVRAAQSAASLLLGDAIARDADGADAGLVKLVAVLANANRHLMEFATDYCERPSAGSSAFVNVPRGMLQQELSSDGYCNIEAINGRQATATEITVDPLRKMTLSGWVRIPGVELTPNLPVFLQLVGAEGQTYVAALLERFPRPDIASYHSDEGEHYYGFNAQVDLRVVALGLYRLQVLAGSVHRPNAAHAVPTVLTFLVG